MTPDNSKPIPPPVESWEAGANDRDLEKYFDWDFYVAAEDRSLDRMIEMHRREEAATRAIMKVKDRQLVAGIFIRKTARTLLEGG